MRKLEEKSNRQHSQRVHTHMRISSSLARITRTATTRSSGSKKRRRSKTTRTSSNTRDENPGLYSALDDVTGGDEEATRYANSNTFRTRKRGERKRDGTGDLPVGTAHECAKVCRTKFYVEQARALFLEHFTIRDRHDREELKTRVSAVDATRRTRNRRPKRVERKRRETIGKRGI